MLATTAASSVSIARLVVCLTVLATAGTAPLAACAAGMLLSFLHAQEGGRPDILEAMVNHNTYLIIIGQHQVYTDMPEYPHHPDPAF